MRRPRSLPVLTAAAAAVLLLLSTPATYADDDTAPDPWTTLTTLRTNLAKNGPTQADFTQTFVPTGFTSGETESGTLAVALPDCLRWDYRDPYPKSFLLCGDQAWYWNPEDGTGRRYPVDRDEEPGLDLLLLSVDTLRQRYDASAEAGDDAATVKVHLTPRRTLDALAEATLTVDPAAGRVVALAYSDAEGNRTRFAITAHRPLEDPDAAFAPPAGIRWEE